MYGYWPVYVPVAKKRQIAEKKIAKLKKQGVKVSPVQIEGRKITTTFWGDAWCKNLEAYSDYESRLPRGRTYVRNGSVIDLKIEAGEITAMVSGTEVYNIKIKIKPISERKWNAIKEHCAGKISSVVELLQGKLSDSVMEIVTRKGEGLFPAPSEIGLTCDCPDWAGLCKHLAAVLYGVGARLDHEPDMLFKLRGIDSSELVDAAIEKSVPITDKSSSRVMDSNELSDVFGVEVDMSGMEDNEKDSSKSSNDVKENLNTAKPAKNSVKSGKQTAKSSKSKSGQGANSKKSVSPAKNMGATKVKNTSNNRNSVKSNVAAKNTATKKTVATKATQTAETSKKASPKQVKSKKSTIAGRPKSSAKVQKSSTGRNSVKSNVAAKNTATKKTVATKTTETSKSTTRKQANSKKSTTAGRPKSSAKVQKSSTGRKSVKSTVKSNATVKQTATKKVAKSKAQKSAEKKPNTKKSGDKAKAAVFTKTKAGQKSAVKSNQKNQKTKSEVPSMKNAISLENERVAAVASIAIKRYGARDRISRTTKSRRRSSVRTRSTATRRRSRTYHSD